MVHLKRLVLMIQFLTTIPIPVSLNVTEEDFGKGLIFAPVVGLLIGAVLAGVYYLLNFLFPTIVASVMILVVYIAITGGLHMDGLGDTFDGLFSNRSKERMLEIMRDSRVGTNAVLAIVCLLFMETTLLGAINSQSIMYVLLLMPVAGRIGSLVGAGFSNYARSGAGLGKSFIDHCGIKQVAMGALFYVSIFFAIKGLTGLILSFILSISAFLLVKFFSRKIGGATGDILGAVCELNQCMYLIVICLIKG